MFTSSRFVASIHALCILAMRKDDTPVCSNHIAASVHTNPVVIRRLMANLERASLIKSVAGRSGGFLLAKPASDISLCDIYNAVEDPGIFRMHKVDAAADCPVAAQMGRILAQPLRNAETALTTSLAATKLSDVVKTFVFESEAA